MNSFTANLAYTTLQTYASKRPRIET